MIIDTHAHYNDEAFDEDRDVLLKSLPNNNIGRVINVGADMKSTEESVLLSEKFPYIYAAVGVHPDSADEINDSSLARLEELCKNKKVVAIGEIGLDYYWDNVDREIQKNAFRKQIALAKKVNLPIIIHSREAAKDTIDILFEEKADPYLRYFRYPTAGFSGCLEKDAYPEDGFWRAWTDRENKGMFSALNRLGLAEK